MQDNRTGELIDLAMFKDKFPKDFAQPWPEGFTPVMENQQTGEITEAKGPDLAAMNQAMKDAGWNREERRRYLAKARKETTP